MEVVNKLAGLATRAANNNIVVDVCLMTSFAVLGVRSLNQQKDIENLESLKESLTKSNKDMKKAIWDLKQQLYAEATASADSALVPLARLKAIYGEALTPQIGHVANEDKESSSSRTKFVV